ncbi:LuxR C-terminal-related transcriptional regulator [Streptosporangium sp. NPDC050855]|uniref:helix-turn-helix transcriptional regulator n=1 Tax=Streptosporangium sp. NPDC050855 TaxID=3366194 RepID=UPI003792B48D
MTEPVRHRPVIREHRRSGPRTVPGETPPGGPRERPGPVPSAARPAPDRSAARSDRDGSAARPAPDRSAARPDLDGTAARTPDESGTVPWTPDGARTAGRASEKARTARWTSAFSALGMTAEAEEVYRYFLRHPGEGVDAAGRALPLGPETVEAAVATLRALSLLDVSDRHRVVATEPQIGIERLIEARLDELNAEIRRVLATRDSIASFFEDHRWGEAPATALIERVEGLERVRRKLDDLSFFTHEETLCLHPGGPLSDAAIETARTLDTRSLRRGVTVKSIYHPRALRHPAMAAYVRDVIDLGGRVHVTQEPMDRMVIFDRSVAVVPMDPRESSRGALLVREPGLVSRLATHFDGLWQASEPPRDLAGPRRELPALSDLERRVLSALATADKDEVAARQMDVSVRTYRRYVADLMARLGATNRFQAALRAKEQNWI